MKRIIITSLTYFIMLICILFINEGSAAGQAKNAMLVFTIIVIIVFTFVIVKEAIKILKTKYEYRKAAACMYGILVVGVIFIGVLLNTELVYYDFRSISLLFLLLSLFPIKLYNSKAYNSAIEEQEKEK